jgi:anti-sigma factor RsiW
MASCRDIDPLVTPYVDGVASTAERALVDTHLQACPPCRHRTALETAARETLRARLCRPCAPDQLRARCLKAAAESGITRIRASRISLTSLSIAVVAILLVGGVLTYSLTGLSPTVLAAQLTLDHVKCFAVHDAKTPVDARASEQRFAREYGWEIQLPQVAGAGLQLVGVRRCYCGDGPAAHVMYRLNGRPISLYMLRDVSRTRASTDVFGHDARIWSNNGRTYVLLGREPEAVMDQLTNTINKALSN